MKKNILYLPVAVAAAICTIACQPKLSLHISGTSPVNNPVSIGHIGQDSMAVVVPKKYKFSYKTALQEASEVYLISTELENMTARYFIAEPGRVKVAIDTAGNFSVTGTKLNDLLQYYYDRREELLNSFRKVFFSHQKKRQEVKTSATVDTSQLNQEEALLDSLEKEIIAFDIQFVTDNVNNGAGQLVLNELVMYSPTLEQLKTIVDAADEEVRRMDVILRIMDRIYELKKQSSKQK